MTQVDSEQLSLYPNEFEQHAKQRNLHLGHSAINGVRKFWGNKFLRWPTIVAAGLSLVHFGVIFESGQAGDTFGNHVVDRVRQGVQGLPQEEYAKFEHIVRERSPSLLKKEAKIVKPIAYQIVNQLIEQAELKYKYDINHDGHIGPPHHTSSNGNGSTHYNFQHPTEALNGTTTTTEIHQPSQALGEPETTTTNP